MVDATDLKSVAPKGACRFKSGRGHHSLLALVVAARPESIHLSVLAPDGAAGGTGRGHQRPRSLAEIALAAFIEHDAGHVIVLAALDLVPDRVAMKSVPAGRRHSLPRRELRLA